MLTLMPVGGAMDHDDPALMKEFVRRSGAEIARIVVLPQASELADTGDSYTQQFKELGVADASVLAFANRIEASTPENIELLRNASGIFIAGGAQMRLSAIYGGTVLEQELHLAYQRGCVVGGTSAGASILSTTMIAYGRGGPTPRERMVQFAPGFGFTRRYVFDQHFRQRDRLGRLIYAVATNPGVIGVGIDENTAAIVEDDETITIMGSGAVTIVDGNHISSTNVADVGSREPVSVAGLTVHVLTAGSQYHFDKRIAVLAPKPVVQ